MNLECRKIKKPFFCTAKVTIVLMLANIMFLTYVYANEENYVNVVSARQEYLIKPIFEDTFSLVLPKSHPISESNFKELNQLKNR